MRGGRFLSLLSLFLSIGASSGQELLLYPRDDPAPAQAASGNGGSAATAINQGGAAPTKVQSSQSTLMTVTSTPAPVNSTVAASTSSSSVTSFAANSTATSSPVTLPLQPTLSPSTGVAGATLILSGLLYGFWSLKNQLIHNFLSVSYAGALAVTCLIVFVESPGGSQGQQAGYVIAAIFTGAILGGLSSPFAALTEGAGCFLGGFCISMWFMCLKDDGLITSKAGSTIFILATTAAIGILGFLRWTRSRALTICIPFSAATAIVLGIDCFARAGLKEFWIYIWGINSNLFPLNTDSYPVTRPVRVETSCIIVVFLVALVVNVKFFKFLEQRKAERQEVRRRKQEELDREEAEAGMRTEMAVSREKLLWERKYGGKGGQSESALVSTDSLKKESLYTNEHRRSGTDTVELSDVDETMSRRVSDSGTPFNIEIIDENYPTTESEKQTEKPKKVKRVVKQERPASPPVIPLPFAVSTIDPSRVPQPAPSRKSSKSVEKEKSVKKFGVGADLEEDKQPMSENGEVQQEDDASERGYESSVFGVDDFSQRGFASRPNSMHSMLSMLVFNDDDPGQDFQNQHRNSMLSIHSKHFHSRPPSFINTREAAQQEPESVETLAKQETSSHAKESRADEAVTTAEPRSMDTVINSMKASTAASKEPLKGEQKKPASEESDKQINYREAIKEESILPQESTTAVAKSEAAETESKDEDTKSRNGTSTPALSSKASTKRRQAAQLNQQSLQQLGGQTSSNLMKAYKQHKIFEWAKESTLADLPPEEELSAPPSPGIRYATVEPDTGKPQEEVVVEEIEEEAEKSVQEEVNAVQSAESVPSQPVKAESVVSTSETEQPAVPLGITPSPSPSLSRQNSAASIRQRPSRNFSSPIFGQSPLHDTIEEEPEYEAAFPEKNSTLLGKREQALKNRLSNVNFNAIPVSAFGQSQISVNASLEEQALEENDDVPLSVRKKLLQNRRVSLQSETPSQMIPQRSFSYEHNKNRDSMASNAPYQSLAGLGGHRLSQAYLGAIGSKAFDSHQPSHGEDRQTPEQRAARLASWRVSLQQDPRHAQQTSLALTDMHREQMMRDKRMNALLQHQQSMEKERLSQVIDQTMRAPDAVMLHMKRLSQMQSQVKLD